MPVVFYQAGSGSRCRVTSVYYDIDKLSPGELAEGIFVSSVPRIEDHWNGDVALLYIDPNTGELWYEYVDMAITQWEQRDQLLAAMDSMHGDIATEGTLAIMNAELVEMKSQLVAVATEVAAVKANQLSGDQKVQLTGNLPEKSSAQYAELATTIKTYNRAAGATHMELYVESGYIRIRTDGEPCTAVTGEPVGEGYGAAWAVPSISVLYVSDAVITVVSR